MNPAITDVTANGFVIIIYRFVADSTWKLNHQGVLMAGHQGRGTSREQDRLESVVERNITETNANTVKNKNKIKQNAKNK